MTRPVLPLFLAAIAVSTSGCSRQPPRDDAQRGATASAHGSDHIDKIPNDDIIIIGDGGGGAVNPSGSTAALLRSCVPISAAGEQRAPSVWGGRIVWSNLADGFEQVFVYDIATAQANAVLYSQNPGQHDFDASIDGGSVVWTTQGPADSGTVVFSDLILAYVLPVASATSSLRFAHPAVGGEYIVWERVDEQQQQIDIDFYSLKLGGPPGPQVTNDPAAQRYPRVSGDFIVYEDYNSNANVPEVVGYRISTVGPPFVIAAKPARTPAIDGNTVVYVGQDAAAMDQITPAGRYAGRFIPSSRLET